jgi:hypothetical protein
MPVTLRKLSGLIFQEIKWSDFSREKYSILKKAVVGAEMLFFIRPEGDITLYTDASDDAVGGHLTQIQDGQEKTIMFVSKIFSSVQRRWSTIDKEMFALYYCVTSLS